MVHVVKTCFMGTHDQKLSLDTMFENPIIPWYIWLPSEQKPSVTRLG